MEEVKKPLLDSPEVKQVKDDLAEYQGLQALANTDGGKTLISNLKRAIASDVDTVISLFKAPELDLRCAVAKLKADLTMYTILIHCEMNVKLAEEALEKLLKVESF